MPTYTPPVADSLFVLRDLLGLQQYSHIPAFAAADEDLTEAVLTEAARFAAEVIAPLNSVSDREGCTLHPNGSVTTPAGFPEAYRSYVEAGWGTLALPEEWGGQGMPHVLASVVEEYLNSACHAFNMYPGLTHGAVAALLAKGGEELKAAYLPRLVSGEWLGTMALTEPQCGTDLGLIRTRAEPAGDTAFSLSGEKIFCSGGEQDLTDNIVHLVLAKLPGAPEGSRGISLFLVPKILPDGTRNALSCGAIEHKMGVHGSATCAMVFDGAKGWLIGQENEGLAAMFIMMNAARLSCGNQGLGQAERAYQNAVAYALDRRQGKAAGERPDPKSAADPIIVHPDVRRMLMDARAFTEGFRALIAWCALQIDLSHHAASEDDRAEADALVGLLTPVIKGFGTDRGFGVTVAMQQVFGGHGYIAEWGMEQYVRDARVAMLYEGANGVQAMDLAARKLVRDRGRTFERFFAKVESDCAEGPQFMAGPLMQALADAQAAARWLLDNAADHPDNVGAGSYAFMELVGIVTLGWMWLRMARAAETKLASGAGNAAFYEAKLATARFYAARTLPDSAALRRKVEAGAQSVMAIPPEAFAAA
ncbi:acyl-CoA dehydrogenase C-terminal domain-containing protein [Altericroceibacterium xinjiangense]|uniref:acyl-CoA dehydrogenase C-terminal domain-containing protein n=1 Tax=Altericroceibacterium xinjiangense TaxID=762261 RepID=UPI000F7F641D|nr:acyl-CoA dehydrogenase C-terminal domain-containing protein [Altericroceibacterium xinjiangense]